MTSAAHNSSSLFVSFELVVVTSPDRNYCEVANLLFTLPILFTYIYICIYIYLYLLIHLFHLCILETKKILQFCDEKSSTCKRLNEREERQGQLL